MLSYERLRGSISRALGLPSELQPPKCLCDDLHREAGFVGEAGAGAKAAARLAQPSLSIGSPRFILAFADDRKVRRVRMAARYTKTCPTPQYSRFYALQRIDFSIAWQKINQIGRDFVALLPKLRFGLVVFVAFRVIARGGQSVGERVVANRQQSPSLKLLLSRLSCAKAGPPARAPSSSSGEALEQARLLHPLRLPAPATDGQQ